MYFVSVQVWFQMYPSNCIVDCGCTCPDDDSMNPQATGHIVT